MDALLRAVTASLKLSAEESPEQGAAPAAPAAAPVLEPKDNVYVIGYSTKSWRDEKGGRHIELEYGKSGMEMAKYDRRQLEEVGFSGKGDNFKWARLYWLSNIDGNPVMFQSDLTPVGFRAPSNQSISFKGKSVHVGNELLSISMLEHLPTSAGWPFLDRNKKFAMSEGGEFLLPGPVFFYDGSNEGDGRYNDPANLMETMMHLQKGASGRPGGKARPLPGSQGKFVGDDLGSDSFRIWDENHKSLARLNGKLDHDSTSYVLSQLSKDAEPEKEGEQPGQKGSVFTPQGESTKGKGEDMSAKEAVETAKGLKDKVKLEKSFTDAVEENTDAAKENGDAWGKHPLLGGSKSASIRVMRAFTELSE